MPGLYTTVRTELTKCAGCVQKQKLQKDAQVEYCFDLHEKGKCFGKSTTVSDGTTCGHKRRFQVHPWVSRQHLSFVMAIAIKGKTHKEVMMVFTDNWTSRLGTSKFLVSDNEFVSQTVQRVCQALNITHLPTPTYNPRFNAQIERQLLRVVTQGLEKTHETNG